MTLTPPIPARLRGSKTAVRQMASFAAIGIASTVAYVVLYSALRGGASAPLANFVALAVTAVANTALNRRLTFGIRTRAGYLADQLAGLGAFALALGITTGAIALLGLVAPAAGRRTELVVLVLASILATVVRFLVLRSWLGRAETTRARALSPSKEVSR